MALEMTSHQSTKLSLSSRGGDTKEKGSRKTRQFLHQWHSIWISNETTSNGRLGRKALGKYAFEEAMPLRLLNLLESDKVYIHKSLPDHSNHITTKFGSNVFNDLVYTIGRLCLQDRSVKTVYLCHPAVQYITKNEGEGNFCGYRNIQMLVSYIRGSRATGCDNFKDLPSVLKLQDLIEEAWDRGFNPEGRQQTGGIRETRKYIGTPEAQALFRSLEIPCKVGTHSNQLGSSSAWESLFSSVQDYFCDQSNNSNTSKVYQTNLPPIYLQRPHHSLTIVGLEIRADDSSNLLVFDPAYRPSPEMLQIVHKQSPSQLQSQISSKYAKKNLTPFRRGKTQLRRYKDFETLILT